MALTRGYRAARFVFIALLLTSLAAGAAAEEAAPEPTAEPVPAAEAPPLNCKPAELIDRADSWSVDCVALWLENLGFRAQQPARTGRSLGPGRACTARSSLARVSNGSMCSCKRSLHRAHPPACAGDLKTPFMGNKVDGAVLAKEPSLSKLEP